jgi:hypothetical protein
MGLVRTASVDVLAWLETLLALWLILATVGRPRRWKKKEEEG